MFQAAFRFLFGDDVFVSYSRADGDTYAAGLANQLTSRKFTCKLDQWGSQPGKEIPPALRAALRRSSIVVLVGSPAAVRSAAVGQEVTEFRKTGRLIIPIDFDNEIRTASWFPLIEGLHCSRENAAALKSGDPSPEVLNRIEKSYTFSRKDQRLRTATKTATAVLTLLIIAGMGASVYAERARRDAVRQRMEADRQTGFANLAKAEAGRQQQEADRQKAIAVDAAKEAAAQQKIAAEQKELAIARQLLAKAELARSQRDDPFALPVKLALEAWRHYPAPEVEGVLRYGLDRLPKLAGDFRHPKPVTGVAFNSNGSLLTTLCEDGVARLWRIGSSNPIQTVEYAGRNGPAVLNSDGTVIAAGDGKSVTVFRIKDNGVSTIGRFAHPAEVTELAFAGGVSRLAVGGPDLSIAVWDIDGDHVERVSEFRETKTAEGLTLVQLQFSQDGRRLAIGMSLHNEAEDETSYPLAVWDVAPAKRIMTDAGYRFALDSDGSKIATSSSGTMWVNEVSEGENTRIARVVQDSGLTGMYFAQGALVTAGRDKTVRGFELYARDINEVLRVEHEDPVDLLRISEQMESVTTVSGGKTVHQWIQDNSAKSGVRLYEALRVSERDEIVDLAVRGRWIATVSKQGRVRVWQKTFSGSTGGVDLSSDDQVDTGNDNSVAGRARARLNSMLHASPPQASFAIHDNKHLRVDEPGKSSRDLAFPERVLNYFVSPDRKMLLVKLEKLPGRLLAVNTGAILRNVDVGDAAAFSPDLQQLAVARGSDVRLVDIRTGRQQRPFPHAGNVTRIRYSPAGGVIATSSGKDSLSLWSVGGVKRRVIEDHAGYGFSPSGGELFVTTRKNGLFLVSAETGAITWHTDGSPADDVVFSPDGQMVAGVSDRTVRAWNVRDGSPVLTADFESDVYGVAFTPERRLMVARERHIDSIILDMRDLVAEAQSRLAAIGTRPN